MKSIFPSTNAEIVIISQIFFYSSMRTEKSISYRFEPSPPLSFWNSVEFPNILIPYICLYVCVSMSSCPCLYVHVSMSMFPCPCLQVNMSPFPYVSISHVYVSISISPCFPNSANGIWNWRKMAILVCLLQTENKGNCKLPCVSCKRKRKRKFLFPWSANDKRLSTILVLQTCQSMQTRHFFLHLINILLMF